MEHTYRMSCVLISVNAVLTSEDPFSTHMEIGVLLSSLVARKNANCETEVLNIHLIKCDTFRSTRRQIMKMQFRGCSL